MRNVAAKARSFVPGNAEVLSGWTKEPNPNINYRPFPKYDASRVKAGIGYNSGDNRTFKNGFKVSNYVYNVSAPGRIYETAGRKNPQGRAPFQQIDPSLPGTTFGKVQGLKASLRHVSTPTTNLLESTHQTILLLVINLLHQCQGLLHNQRLKACVVVVEKLKAD
jgi:hypothetical protein